MYPSIRVIDAESSKGDDGLKVPYLTYLSRYIIDQDRQIFRKILIIIKEIQYFSAVHDTGTRNNWLMAMMFSWYNAGVHNTGVISLTYLPDLAYVPLLLSRKSC